MAFGPSTFLNSRSITHLASSPSLNLPMNSSDESYFFKPEIACVNLRSVGRQAHVFVELEFCLEQILDSRGTFLVLVHKTHKYACHSSALVRTRPPQIDG